ncbi:MAG: aldolase [Methanosarcina thermophila]|jgi:fructose-bisphosphate aldolase/6-deoxy-5-ketofructose 1-phosphate synthase|uniref:fructose-bisphosphate aldolase n=3 Tax=Methanosarcina thermophila TaxID=2210 RepID=A0A1I6YHS1_METTE|nr:aldolase [Methanosarcina thermophila]ALK05295.1 MAG: aldolase [Methanosarcina sp. 795]AKB14073.1 Fructose-bisphosphate aldolase/6-deoxy-5-ketofructose 1-phosphate synthase [Methanosarcina thermophila TM-1]AKB15283.1 Fructose-bisphosphate aldolase/6-deoxy-5-ketofructose 1-phosphate synthase [Methanosarcina thermophila CHTI-55]NLU56256.1 aldolase [Methanosarcina thermophila]SFT49950.1 fructose-bisphosphate aldolase [Methanosarcina thermophila]
MVSISREEVIVPLDVPKAMRETYIDNYMEITRGTGRLMLFAGDQKVEHLNDDFYGEGIPEDDADPEHLFRIASRSKIGVFATQLGLIARYGMDYRDVPYLVKINSKTNLVKTAQADPFSNLWYDVEQVVEFKENSGFKILGVGYTIYLGSEFEAEMLVQAAQVVYNAHQHGMVSVLWIYPRGAAVKDEKDPHLIAGATGVGACLGTDFVKVNYPKKEGAESAEIFKEAIKAAGRTKVVCAGGSSDEVETFLRKLYDQIHISGAQGNATGRNIHQKPLEEAIRMCNAIYAITVEDSSVEDALKIYKGK